MKTTSGPVYQMWVDEINADGGMYVEEYGKKLPIEFIQYDDKSDITTMTQLLEKLIVEDKVDFVLAESPGAFEGSSMPASFGILFIMQNGLILIWGADIRKYAFLDCAVSLGGSKFSGNRLLTLVLALVIGLVFYLFLARTRLGKAIRAAAQDPSTAGLMGVNINQVLAVCFGLGAMMAAFAGVLLSMSYPIKATDGLDYTIIAMIVVVLGGLGSIPWSSWALGTVLRWPRAI